MKISQNKKDEMMKQSNIQAFHDALIQQQRYKKIKLSKVSMWDYLYEVDMFYRQIGLEPCEKPTLEQAEQWREEHMERYARKTLAKKICALNHYLELCCGSPKNPLEQCPNITREKTPLRLSRESVMEMVDLLKSKGKHTEACLVFTCFSTATRKGVLHRIKLSNLDFENNAIRLERCKGDLDHTVPMDKKDMAVIKEYIDNHRSKPIEGNEDYLFLTKKGKKVYEDRFRDVLRYCGRALGIEQRVHPHALRRARILDLRHQGYQWEEIMQVTAHRDISSLLAYIQEEDFQKVHDKLNNGNAEPEPQPIPQQTDIDKELELIEKKLELAHMEEKNLQVQLSLRKDNLIEPKTPDVGQLGYN